MIELTGLRRSFGSVVALDGLDLIIPAGRIVGLLGPNGAGKTTLLNILTTLLVPSAGRAVVDGLDVATQGLELRRRLGYVPEHATVYEGLTAQEYLELAGGLHALERATLQGRIDRFLEHFELGAERGRRLGTYSKGMRRKVLVSAALLHDPRVVLLDEPLDGLDVASQKKVVDLLAEVAARGATVLYSSHVLPQVEDICEHLVVIHEGRVRFEGAMADLRARHDGDRLSDAFLRITVEGGNGTRSLAQLLGDAPPENA